MAVQRAVHDDASVTFNVLLTPREREVLLMLAEGLSAKEVALKLKITSRTVESHIDKLRLKTRSRNRTHMVAQAIHLGLL